VGKGRPEGGAGAGGRALRMATGPPGRQVPPRATPREGATKTAAVPQGGGSQGCRGAEGRDQSREGEGRREGGGHGCEGIGSGRWRNGGGRPLPHRSYGRMLKYLFIVQYSPRLLHFPIQQLRLYSSQRLDFAILEEVDLSNFLQHSRKLALSGK